MRRTETWALTLLLAAPLLIIAGKLPGSPAAALFGQWFSLEGLPLRSHRILQHILLVPLGAVVVSFFRMTLGIRAFSIFRPILLGMAFQAAGIALGLAFLAGVLAVVACIRPLLRHSEYYARVPVLAAIVAGLTALPLVVEHWFHGVWLEQLGHFPVIALCLTAESFNKMLDKHRTWQAIQRAASTAAIGAVLAAVAGLPGALDVALRFPEALVAQVGLVLLISRSLNFRLLENQGWRRLSGAGPGAEAEGVALPPETNF